MSAIFVTLGGLFAISAIVWWFWLSGPQATRAAGSQVMEIRVEGGTYQPAVITAPAGKPLTLRFLRLDATPCAERVVFASLDIMADIPFGHPHEIVLPPLQAGTHEFTCQMGMYRGKVIAQ
jgi:plastocyanin domain-containing protein